MPSTVIFPLEVGRALGVVETVLVHGHQVEEIVNRELGALAKDSTFRLDNGSMTHEEVHSVNAVGLENLAIARTGVERTTEDNIGVRSGNSESIRGLTEGPSFVFANLFRVFAEDGIRKGIRHQDLTAAGLVSADEVGSLILIPSEVVPCSAAEALTHVHNQSVSTGLFPFELEQGAGLGEEVIVEIVKSFRVDRSHAHGGDQFAKAVHDTVRSTLSDGHGTGIVDR